VAATYTPIHQGRNISRFEGGGTGPRASTSVAASKKFAIIGTAGNWTPVIHPEGNHYSRMYHIHNTTMDSTFWKTVGEQTHSKNARKGIH
jgi:hypothetical protein